MMFLGLRIMTASCARFISARALPGLESQAARALLEGRWSSDCRSDCPNTWGEFEYTTAGGGDLRAKAALGDCSFLLARARGLAARLAARRVDARRLRGRLRFAIAVRYVTVA